MTKTIYKADTREVIAIITDRQHDVVMNGYSIQCNKDNDKNSKIYELGADAKYKWEDGKLILCENEWGGGEE